jgi:hypothetical protein
MPAQPAATESSTPRKTRRTRQQSEEVARYFLAKEGSSVEKLELGAEAASEGEALIKACKYPPAKLGALRCEPLKAA